MKYNLKSDYNLDCLEKIFHCEFSSGHAGDFFISLYSLANADFPNSVPEFDMLTWRLDQKVIMPGNNIGGKINETVPHAIKRIRQTMDELRDMKQSVYDLTKIKYLNFASHPSKLSNPQADESRHTNIPDAGRVLTYTDEYPYDVLEELFDSTMPIDRFILVPTTFESAMFTVCFFCCYNTQESLKVTDQEILAIMKEQLDNYLPTGDSMINIAGVRDTAKFIDHVDIAFNSKEKILALCKDIVSNNIDMQRWNYIYNHYMNTRVTEFYDWMQQMQATRNALYVQLEELYENHEIKAVLDNLDIINNENYRL